jgi:hypothetical protein
VGLIGTDDAFGTVRGAGAGTVGTATRVVGLTAGSTGGGATVSETCGDVAVTETRGAVGETCVGVAVTETWGAVTVSATPGARTVALDWPAGAPARVGAIDTASDTLRAGAATESDGVAASAWSAIAAMPKASNAVASAARREATGFRNKRIA